MMQKRTSPYMPAQHHRSATACLCVCAAAIALCAAPASADTTLFDEDFNRTDSNTVGNGWAGTESSTSVAAISGNRLVFNTVDGAYDPVVYHTFSSVSSTTLTWSFTFNWVRSGSEGTYAVWMQLCNSSSMVTPSTSNSTGVAVNLKWAGTSNGMSAHQGFGYVTNNGAATTQIQTLSGSHTVLITADLANNEYDIAIDGSTVASDIAFDNNVAINAVRMYADEVTAANFSSRYFDNVEITAVDLFTSVSSSTGFDVQTTSDESYGSGLHWADLDGDGDLDCIIAGDTAKLALSSSEGASFFMSNFGGSVRRQGALLDVDDDGDIDFFTCNDNDFDTESFFTNNASATFTDAGDYGFDDGTNNEAVAAADVDGDGLCDLVMFSELNNWIGLNGGGSPPAFTGSNASGDGLNDAGDYGNGDYCSSADVNGDGYLDFFYHYNSGKLFLSDADGTYTENASGISVTTGNTDKFGSAWGDYDNDGDLDLFCSRYDSGQTGYLWRNSGGTFTNVASSAGISNTSGHRGCAWGDVDNDGDLDLYICTRSGDNVLYRNNDDGTFTACYDTLGAEGSGDAHDAVFVDYDNDGDLDIAVTREDTTNRLYRNATDDSSYLKVRVVGAGEGATNKAGVGVRVDLYDAAGTTFLQRRDIGVARGFGGTEPLWAHFGGVTPSTTYTVKVHFASGVVSQSVTPSSASTTIGSTTIDQMVTITEPEPEIEFQVIQWIETDPLR